MTAIQWGETIFLWLLVAIWVILLLKSVNMYKEFRDTDAKLLTNVRKMIAFMYISAHEEVATLNSQEIHYVVKWVLIKSEERNLDHNELVEFTDEMLKVYLQEKETREGSGAATQPAKPAKKPKPRQKQTALSVDPEPMEKLQIDLE